MSGKIILIFWGKDQDLTLWNTFQFLFFEVSKKQQWGIRLPPNNCDSLFSLRDAASKWSDKELHVLHITLYQKGLYV